MRMQVQSLVSLSGLRIRHCREPWCRSQTRLGSLVAVAVAQDSSYSSDSTHSLGTSICSGCGPPKKRPSPSQPCANLCAAHNPRVSGPVLLWPGCFAADSLGLIFTSATLAVPTFTLTDSGSFSLKAGPTWWPSYQLLLLLSGARPSPLDPSLSHRGACSSWCPSAI